MLSVFLLDNFSNSQPKKMTFQVGESKCGEMDGKSPNPKFFTKNSFEIGQIGVLAYTSGTITDRNLDGMNLQRSYGSF